MKVRFEEGVRRGRQLTLQKSEDVRSEVAGKKKANSEGGKEKEELHGFHDVGIHGDSFIIPHDLNDKPLLIPNLPPANPQVRPQLSTR